MDLQLAEIQTDPGMRPVIDFQLTERGVSLDYVLTPGAVLPPDYRWFVMRVPYGKEREVERVIRSSSRLPYVPVRSCTRVLDGRRVVEEESCVPNLLFVLSTEDDLVELTKHPIAFPDQPHRAPAQLRFMYDHTRKNAMGRDQKMTVPHADMVNFIRVTMQQDEHVRVYMADQLKTTPGDWVEVIEGKFKGVRGRVARLHGQTCVLVDLQGLCIASTAYIPSAFLRRSPLSGAISKR